MLNHCVVLHAIDATPAARNDLVKNCRVHPTHWLISTQMQTVADEAGHRDAAVLDLGVAQPADGVLVASSPEIGVGEAERVVEANDRVELDGERLKVGLGLLDLDRGAGGRRGHEGRGQGQGSEGGDELLRWGLTVSFLCAMVARENGGCCDCKFVCVPVAGLVLAVDRSSPSSSRAARWRVTRWDNSHHHASIITRVT